MALPIHFIVHGKLKGKGFVAALEAKFGPRAKLYFTQFAGHTQHLAHEIALTQSGYIIAVGGDGTLHEVINGAAYLLDTTQIKAFGVLPAGSGNDFAKSIGMRNELSLLAQLIDNERIEFINHIHLSFTGLQGEPTTRRCINIADIGIGGDVAQNFAFFGRKLGGKLGYVFSILKCFGSYKYKEVKVVTNHWIWHKQQMLSLVMANASHFGSGMGIAPHAHLRSDNMAIVAIGNLKVMDYLRYLSQIRRAKFIAHKEVAYAFATQLSIATPSKSVAIDIDGEFVGFAPLTATLVKGKIPFLVNNIRPAQTFIPEINIIRP